MTHLYSLGFLFLIIFFAPKASGQINKSEREFNEYLKQPAVKNIDTVLIVKAGCAGCEMKYPDTSITVTDGQTIYVLTEVDDKFKLAIFDDAHSPWFIDADSCPLFKLVNENKISLEQKKVFYDKEIPKIKSKSGFYPPPLIHYEYESLTIHISNFNYDFNIYNDNMDYFGLKRDKEKWFIATKKIIIDFFDFLKSIKVSEK